MNVYKVSTLLAFLLFIPLTYSSGRIVNVSLKMLPENVEIPKLSTMYEAIISSHLSEGLFKITTGNQIEYRLAKKMKWSNNHHRLTITLKNRKFSDGKTVNAKDVVTSLVKCVKGPRNKTSHALSKISGYKDFIQGKVKVLGGISAISPKVLIIDLIEPAPLLIDELAMGTCNIWKGDNDDFLDGAIGSGDYILTEVKPNQISLKRSPFAEINALKPEFVNFYKEKENINFEHDLITSDKRIEKIDKKYVEYERSELLSRHLVLNNSIYPFSDIRIRKLIADSIDFSKIQEFFQIPKNRMQEGLIPFGMPGFKQRVLNFEKNLIKLKKRYKELGFTEKKKLTFDLYIRDTYIGRKEKDFWSEIFINFPISVKVKFVKTNLLFNQSKNKKFQAMRVGKYAGAVDPFRLLSSYHSTSPWNTAHASITECDNVILSGLKVVEKLKRYEKYIKMDECLIEKNQILIPLFTVKPSFVYLNDKWRLPRKNRFLLYPHRVYEWELNEEQ